MKCVTISDAFGWRLNSGIEARSKASRLLAGIREIKRRPSSGLNVPALISVTPSQTQPRHLSSPGTGFLSGKEGLELHQGEAGEDLARSIGDGRAGLVGEPQHRGAAGCCLVKLTSP